MAEVNVKIKAQNQTRTGFQQALGDAQRFGNTASGSLRSAFAGVASDIKSSIGGALAGLASIGAIKSVIDQFGRIQDLSEQFGVSAETLQRFGQLASESGSSIDQMAAAFSRLTINIQKAQGETGAQADAMRTLGLSASEMANLSPEQAFLKLADALKSSGGTNEAYSATLALIGNRQQNLIPLLQQGAEAIKAQSQGIAVASDETVAKVDAIYDRFQRLGQQLAVGLGPGIALIGQTLLGAFSVIQSAVTQLSTFLGSSFAAAGQAMSGNFAAAGEIMRGEAQTAAQEWENLKNKLNEINAPAPVRQARGALGQIEAQLDDQNTEKTKRDADREAQKLSEERERIAKSKSELDQEIRLKEARLRGDKKAEENILQQQDMNRVLEAGGSFEQAANMASLNALERQIQAQQAINQGAGFQGSSGASAFQRVGLATNEFFDTRKPKDPAADTKRAADFAKQILEVLKKGEPLVLNPTSS
jgi:hypothetical protein